MALNTGALNINEGLKLKAPSALERILIYWFDFQDSDDQDKEELEEVWFYVAVYFYIDIFFVKG